MDVRIAVIKNTPRSRSADYTVNRATEPYRGFFEEIGFNAQHTQEASMHLRYVAFVQKLKTLEGILTILPEVKGKRSFYYQLPKTVPNLEAQFENELRQGRMTSFIQEIKNQVNLYGGQTWYGWNATVASGEGMQVIMCSDTNHIEKMADFKTYIKQMIPSTYEIVNRKKLEILLESLPTRLSQLQMRLIQNKKQIKSSLHKGITKYTSLDNPKDLSKAAHIAHSIIRANVEIAIEEYDAARLECGLEIADQEFHNKVAQYCSTNDIPIKYEKLGAETRIKPVEAAITTWFLG